MVQGDLRRFAIATAQQADQAERARKQDGQGSMNCQPTRPAFTPAAPRMMMVAAAACVIPLTEKLDADSRTSAAQIQVLVFIEAGR
jgi:hypothetical protein